MQDSYIRQIEETLRRVYLPMLPALPHEKDPIQADKARLSRALAALAIQGLAFTTPLEAVRAVVDQPNDNGIDAVFFDRQRSILFLIQAKYGSAPDSGDNKKFCTGICDLKAERLACFHWGIANSREGDSARIRSEVEAALATDGVRMIAAHVYLENALQFHAIRDLNQLAIDLNKHQDCFEWQQYNLESIYSWLTNQQKIVAPNITITVKNWKTVSTPRFAVYGTVDVNQLAQIYKQHSKNIFEKNVRYFLGRDTINQAIETTAIHSPNDMLYLNNGVVAICSDIEWPLKGSEDICQFTIKEFSIVNGAQTMGSLYAAVTANGNSLDANSKIFITIIKASEEEAFGTKITRARNSQNPIQSLERCAQDPRQEQLRRELQVSGISYLYRPSTTTGLERPTDTIIRIEKSMLALACFNGATELAVVALQNPSLLYDPNGQFYSMIYTRTLTGVRLCRLTRIFILIEGYFVEWIRLADGRKHSFHQYCPYFVMHILSRVARPLLNKVEIDLSEPDIFELKFKCHDIAETIFSIAEKMYPDPKGYLSTFTNIIEASQLAKEVMAILSTEDSSPTLYAMTDEVFGPSDTKDPTIAPDIDRKTAS